MGWDACAASIAKAQAFWSNTPYWNMGLYLGGSSYGSGCKRWSSAEVGQLRTMGYKFLPLWVGPQAPCTGFPSRFSTSTATAYDQGRAEAKAVYNVAAGLGWDTTDAPMIYDLEGFDTTNGGCLNATKSFIDGWVYQLHVAPAQRAGVYGSSCASGLNSYSTIANVPDFIHGASWNGVKSTSDLSCIPAGNWTQRQRHKQYQGGHNETWNGVTMNVDSDCSNGPVYPGPDNLTSPQGCE
ncbi:DUF1906 domain-containing protein [Actinomadura barringtoniae]|uniref:DUF1906 domain-containing protein n=1 Tax=Actinomadura barringtoniae TaxID=1427535 RepID=A0A939PCW1_9ACTN|nr:glycoside hydrolase domain-containing protein [Actinomadura barringtoniae]MBO2446146.1 DUF1906 domain-containing protein [Actinomadura barringtoniae]